MISFLNLCGCPRAHEYGLIESLLVPCTKLKPVKLMAPAMTVVILLATKILQNVSPLNKELQKRACVIRLARYVCGTKST